MSYYFEIWLRGFAKDQLKILSDSSNEDYHPHITFVRPFNLKTSEKEIKKVLENFCKNQKPIKFALKGIGNFNESVKYIPILKNKELMEFNNNLEILLENLVEYYPKLNNKKILHVTLESRNIGDCEKIDQYMLRLTGIKNKKIWFSYDFIFHKILNRTDSLNKSLWYKTVHEFSNQYNLLPTRNGYKKIP